MVILGIDPSYTRTGISVAKDGELKDVLSFGYSTIKNKAEKRVVIKRQLKSMIKMYNPDKIIVERTRQFSKGTDTFMSMAMIKAGISIITTIIDIALEYGLKTYSVDTRSWKSQVVGSSRPIDGNKKQLTLEFVESLGYPVNGDNDGADAACISLFWWYAERKSGAKRRDELLKLEE